MTNPQPRDERMWCEACGEHHLYPRIQPPTDVDRKVAEMLTEDLVKGAGQPLDTYDALEILSDALDQPTRILVHAAATVADLWNDPPSQADREEVKDAFPELAAALDTLLGGGPNNPPLTWADVRPAKE